ncbi:MAG: DNA translocase FtsK, partial [Firmicutes bacterium]|nr:DNA translocase FtsK [Bacillota bacterium]
HSSNAFGEAAASSNMTDRQRKIMGYMNSDNRVSGRDGMKEEPLDFSLGENKEKPKRGRRKKAEIEAELAAKDAAPEAEAFGRAPVIVGGFSPKAAEEKLTKAEAAKAALKEEDFNITLTSSESYQFPSIDLLKKASRTASNRMEDENSLRAKAMKLEDTLRSFNISATVTNVTQGPAVTRYEVHPDVGVKVKSIKNLADDIALNMEAKSIRIEAPIPGKPAVGIEIENDRINMVTVREIIDSAEFKKSESKITFAVGKDISGKAIVADLKTMPHMLIAGSTGSGKSVCINSIIASILYKARPDEVKLVLIDPKVVELANYSGIPHLLIPVVTEPVKAAAALNWAVAEMDDRYRKFAEEGVRELASYNRVMREKGEEDSVMPQVVIIIDELADLMMAAPSQVEESICRLAQKARAAGMHLIVATQRPSVDVITGVIKANIPSRIAFAVSSQFDSRTILDMAGAEKLVGKGDMLFNPLGGGKPTRVQGTFISDQEVHDVIKHVKSQVEEVEYADNVMDTIERANVPDAEKGNRDLEDELLPEAIELVVQAQQASVSMLQRRFRIGYNRAARIIDMMEDRQIIGPSDGSRPRSVLISEEDLDFMRESTEDIEDEL